MNKFTFTNHSAYERQPEIKITIETDAVTLPEVLNAFESFLRASGFSIPQYATLDFIEDDLTESDSDESIEGGN